MSLVWRCSEHSQRVQICDAVISHLLEHQQQGSEANEAGGQLFGTVTSKEVRVTTATGPYQNDERGRYRYRSDAQSAQQAISDQAIHGLIYIGEWHTHAEDEPRPSDDDIAAMNALRTRSRLNASSALLVIVGRVPPPQGLAICSFSARGRIDWYCGEQTKMRRNYLTRIVKIIFRHGAEY